MTPPEAPRDPALQALLDKQEISEIIYRYCRGLDRMDAPLTLSCWHEGGTDDHGALFRGSAEAFVEWLWPVHAALERTQHTIHNILVELDGDRAGAESYYIVYLRSASSRGALDVVTGGRYCDHFERREGLWKIRHRQSVADWVRVDPVRDLDQVAGAVHANNPDNRTLVGTRDRTDYSYQVLGGAE